MPGRSSSARSFARFAGLGEWVTRLRTAMTLAFPIEQLSDAKIFEKLIGNFGSPVEPPVEPGHSHRHRPTSGRPRRSTWTFRDRRGVAAPGAERADGLGRGRVLSDFVWRLVLGEGVVRRFRMVLSVLSLPLGPPDECLSHSWRFQSQPETSLVVPIWQLNFLGSMAIWQLGLETNGWDWGSRLFLMATLSGFRTAASVPRAR